MCCYMQWVKNNGPKFDFQFPTIGDYTGYTTTLVTKLKYFYRSTYYLSACNFKLE